MTTAVLDAEMQLRMIPLVLGFVQHKTNPHCQFEKGKRDDVDDKPLRPRGNGRLSPQRWPRSRHSRAVLDGLAALQPRPFMSLLLK